MEVFGVAFDHYFATGSVEMDFLVDFFQNFNSRANDDGTGERLSPELFDLGVLLFALDVDVATSWLGVDVALARREVLNCPFLLGLS